MSQFVLFFLICFILSKDDYIDSYFHLDNKLEYQLIEYAILKSDKHDIFVLNQPYRNSQVFKLMENIRIFNDSFCNRYNYLRKESKSIGLKSNLGFNKVKYDENNPFKIFIHLDGYADLGNIILVNSIDIDKALKDDIYYHGDKDEWATAYITNSYFLYKKNNLEIFGGRTLRNFGALNDYSLLFSDNSYSFDHYGFSATNNKIKYSFYCTRLNDIDNGQDIQGIVIPEGLEAVSKRFFSIQRLDFKIYKNFQGSVSAATIYGGPNQGFIADFINPLNLYYLSQRNNQIQMNNLYQLNLYYKLNNKSILIDFLIDDIIVNNESGATDRYDNRFGLMLKGSLSDFIINKSLFAIRYVKVWNETYLSYRNFENYVFFNKGIGFPYNGFEGLKISFSSFKYESLFNNIELEIYRKGDNELLDLFSDQPASFPSGRVDYGISFLLDLLYYGFRNMDISFSYNYNQYSEDFSNLFKDFDSNSFYKFKLVYNFQY